LLPTLPYPKLHATSSLAVVCNNMAPASMQRARLVDIMIELCSDDLQSAMSVQHCDKNITWFL
jgi:hypothetical protein